MVRSDELRELAALGIEAPKIDEVLNRFVALAAGQAAGAIMPAFLALVVQLSRNGALKQSDLLELAEILRTDTKSAPPGEEPADRIMDLIATEIESLGADEASS